MGGPGGGLRSASAQCGVVKRDVTNCLKERAEAALNCFCATGDTLAAWLHPWGLPAFHWAACWWGKYRPSLIPAFLALNPHILWLPILLFAQLGTSQLQAKPLCPQNQYPQLLGPQYSYGPELSLWLTKVLSAPLNVSSSSQNSGVLVQAVWTAEEDR